MKTLPDNPRVLIVRFSSLGDVVKCTALPRLIRKRWPGARITFLTAEAHAELLADNPHLTRVIAFQRRTGLGGLLRLARELRAEGFDLVVDVHRSLRSRILCAMIPAPRTAYSKRSRHRWLLLHWRVNRFDGGGTAPGKEADFLAGLRPWGVEDDGQGTELHVAPLEQGPDPDGRLAAEIATVTAWLGEGGMVLGVAPVAAWPLKRWPLEHVEALLRGWLGDTTGRAILFGGPGEDEVERLAGRLAAAFPGRVLSLVGRTTHMESARFAAACDLMLANDTGMSHIAEAVGVNALVLFGPTTREWGYFPVRPGSRVLERDLPCRPCSRTGSGACTHPARQICMRGITPGEVREALDAMLGA